VETFTALKKDYQFTDKQAYDTSLENELNNQKEEIKYLNRTTTTLRNCLIKEETIFHFASVIFFSVVIITFLQKSLVLSGRKR
jgi:hypothetical protein